MNLINSLKHGHSLSTEKDKKELTHVSPLKSLSKQRRNLAHSIGKYAHMPDKNKRKAGIKKIKNAISKNILHVNDRKLHASPDSYQTADLSVDGAPSFPIEETCFISGDEIEVHDEICSTNSSMQDSRVSYDDTRQNPNKECISEVPRSEVPREHSCSKLKDMNPELLRRSILTRSIMGIFFMASSWLLSSFLSRKKQPAARSTFLGSAYKY